VTWALLTAAALAASCPAADDAQPPAAQRAVCALEARSSEAAAADRARLEDIFSRDRYQRARASDAGSFKALLDRVRAWLASIFESGGAQSFSNVTRFVVAILAAVLAAVGAARLFLRGGARRARSTAGPVSPTALELESPAEHLARARAALASAPREAIREALFALLSALEDARLARPDRVRTNRELVNELPSRGADQALVAKIDPLMRWYDGAFYSLEPVPQDGAARFVDDVARLSGQLEGAAR
jgi:hypothetical protein